MTFNLCPILTASAISATAGFASGHSITDGVPKTKSTAYTQAYLQKSARYYAALNRSGVPSVQE